MTEELNDVYRHKVLSGFFEPKPHENVFNIPEAVVKTTLLNLLGTVEYHSPGSGVSHDLFSGFAFDLGDVDGRLVVEEGLATIEKGMVCLTEKGKAEYDALDQSPARRGDKD